MPTIHSASRWYSAADPVHGFDHVLRVYRLAEYIADCEAADLEIVRAAVLLHDIDAAQMSEKDSRAKSEDGLQRQQHQHTSSEFAAQILQQEGWQAERISAVQHCILAHRFRDESEQPQTLEARVLYDADKLDAIGAVGVARALAFALQAGQPLYASPSNKFSECGQLEPGEPHSAFHEYLFKLRKLKASLSTPTGIKLSEERHSIMQEYFANLAAEMEFTTKTCPQP
ncbi:MAG: hypothetical protein A2Z16_13165 [Chloroflexi bacterium RBG_16_54_18]|nr:MAG: hypothetical protein A2Z16_13165 [Chloroflexi bacterium RBG_16_54_18]